MRSDDQLVALFRMGYDEAFRAIHDRYRQRLLAYTRQMLAGSRSDAEDVLQDVFLRAYAALRQDDRPVTLRAWLYRVAHNRCIDHLRRPVPAAAEVFQLSRMPQRDPQGETERREDLRELVRDVQRLPEQQRSALLMRELDGLSYAELADALDTSVPAIKSLLVRARIGLVEAGEARDTDCADIRAEIAFAHGRGVRASARSRKHLRDCSGCREYRRVLRGRRAAFSALGGGPLAAIAKLLGIGGGASGAAAGAGAGGSAAVVGGATAATATKIAAVVCCAAVVGGGAVEVRQHVTDVKPSHRSSASHARAASSGAKAAAAAAAPTRVVPLTAPARRASDPMLGRDSAPSSKHSAAHHARGSGSVVHREEPAALNTPDTAVSPPTPEEVQTGGAMAPDEDTMPGPSATGGNGTVDAPDANGTPVDPSAVGVAPGSGSGAGAGAGAGAGDAGSGSGAGAASQSGTPLTPGTTASPGPSAGGTPGTG
jgi:RNA polymerase sigma factor (sigma-70 family)